MHQLYTVVIPAHNRPERLKRLLDYYLSFNVRIVVPDSSSVPFKYLAEYKDKIVYKHYPKVLLAEKLFFMLNEINTPYVVMCADDDYIVPSAIEQVICYLDNHLEYGSGQGIYTRYYPHKSRIHFFLEYSNMIKEDINEETPSERIIHLMSNYFQYYYAVFRSEIFKEIIHSTFQNDCCKIKNLNLLEIYLSLYATIEAKHIVLPIFYAAREAIIGSAGSYTDNIDRIMTDLKYKEEYIYFMDKLSEKILQKSPISKKEGSLILRNAISLYLDNSVHKASKKPNYTKSFIKRAFFKMDRILINESIRLFLHRRQIYSILADRNFYKKELKYIEDSIFRYYTIYN